jgi:hypothetical protein
MSLHCYIYMYFVEMIVKQSKYSGTGTKSYLLKSEKKLCLIYTENIEYIYESLSKLKLWSK